MSEKTSEVTFEEVKKHQGVPCARYPAQEYETPRLHSYGSLSELIRGDSGPPDDFAGEGDDLG